MKGMEKSYHEGLLRVLQEIRDVAQQGLTALGQDPKPEPEVEIAIRPPGEEEEEPEEMYS